MEIRFVRFMVVKVMKLRNFQTNRSVDQIFSRSNCSPGFLPTVGLAWSCLASSLLCVWSLPLSIVFSAVDSGGHGPIQPTHPRHLGDQFPHLPVALPQSQPLGVRARQPRLPQPQRQAEGGMELQVTLMVHRGFSSFMWLASVVHSDTRRLCFASDWI